MIDNFKTDLALSQIINQLSDSPNYISIIRAISKAYDDQDYVLNYISTIDVYTAQGVWLDLLGSIVGQVEERSTSICHTFILDFMT